MSKQLIQNVAAQVFKRLPRSEAWAKTELSLPMFPGLSDNDADTVIRAVRAFFSA